MQQKFTFINGDINFPSHSTELNIYKDSTLLHRHIYKVSRHLSTYLHYDLFTLYLGLAWVSGMCHPEYSCTINEGNNFESGIIHILRKHIFSLFKHPFPI